MARSPGRARSPRKSTRRPGTTRKFQLNRTIMVAVFNNTGAALNRRLKTIAAQFKVSPSLVRRRAKQLFARRTA